MEKAIKKSIEGGWRKSENWFRGVLVDFLIDPLFWQALGKAEGWDKCCDSGHKFEGMTPDTSDGASEPVWGGCEFCVDEAGVYRPEWNRNWHRFIDHRAEGKDAESFFNELLK